MFEPSVIANLQRNQNSLIGPLAPIDWNRVGQTPQMPVQSYNSAPGGYQGQISGPLAGAPQNMNTLPTDANGNPSWGAGPQTQQLPNQSPFGTAWGGGQGTTYAPITMNQQAGLLSANYEAPNGWMNGLLYNGPWQQYYG